MQSAQKDRTYTILRVRRDTHRRLKIEAAMRGLNMLDLFEVAVDLLRQQSGHTLQPTPAPEPITVGEER